MPSSGQTMTVPRTEEESDDCNDQLSLFIRQVIDKENSSPLQHVKLVHPLGHLGFTGWPLVTPLRVQLLKCDKCSRDFCSTMNYRRHILMHRRSSNVDKESQKTRDLLEGFWDKLPLEEAGKLASFDDISLEGVSGSEIVKAWASFISKPGIVILPEVYAQAGCILLEIIQAKSSRPPISSRELFSTLDVTSEGNFLCAGSALSVQKFVVDGEAKKSLEYRNLVASMSLLFEQKLIKGWLAEKDAEALRCQKILMEEEEVAQKRQAQASEKKRRKKLRQKEQKAKGKSTGEKIDNNVGENMDNNVDSLDIMADFVEAPASAKISLEQNSFSGKEDEELVEALNGYSSTNVGVESIKNVGPSKEWETNGLYQPTVESWKVVKSYRRGQVALLGSRNLQDSKLGAMQKKGPADGGKIWARESKNAIDQMSSRMTLQNKIAKSANDVEISITNLQNVATKDTFYAESSRTTLQTIVSESSNGEESSRPSWKSIVSKGKTDSEDSRGTLQNVAPKSAIELESARTSFQNLTNGVEIPRTSLRNLTTGGIEVESSRTTLQTIVSESSNDEESSRPSWKNIVSKGETDSEDSRSTLQNVAAKSTIELESARTSFQNLTKGAIGEESSRTTLRNVAAKGANGVEIPRTSLRNLTTGGIEEESSITTSHHVVEKSSNDEESSRTSLQNIVSKGAIELENPRTTLQNTVAKIANDVESSRRSLQNIEKGAIDLVGSGTTLQNIVAESAKDVASSRTSSQNVVASHIDTSNSNLMIGSIPVMVKNGNSGQHVSQGATTNSSDKCVKPDGVLKGQDLAVAMTGDRCEDEMKGDLPVQRGNHNCREKDIIVTVEDQTVTVKSRHSHVAKPNVSITINNNSYMERNIQPAGSVFSSFDVEAFLTQRWQNANTSDHVKLVLSPEPPCDADGRKDCSLLVHTTGSRQYTELAGTSGAEGGPRISLDNENSKGKGKETETGVSRMKYSQRK